MENFEIKRNILKRNYTRHIILTPATNFIESNSYINNIVYNSSKYYTWDIYEKYFVENLHHYTLPCHYFIERVNEDYVSIVGEQIHSPSYWIELMANIGAINYDFRYSIVIGLGFNFNKYPLDRRLCIQLSKKVLCPLLYKYKLSPEDIYFIDDILNDDYQDIINTFMKGHKIIINKSKYFDINILMQYVEKYKIRSFGSKRS